MEQNIILSKEEFKAFLLIYAAQTNFIETNEELEFIELRFSKEIIQKIRKLISTLNDYQKSELIIKHIKHNDYSQKDLDSILNEIKEMYDSDGKFDSLEQSIFYMLEKLLTVN